MDDLLANQQVGRLLARRLLRVCPGGNRARAGGLGGVGGELDLARSGAQVRHDALGDGRAGDGGERLTVQDVLLKACGRKPRLVVVGQAEAEVIAMARGIGQAANDLVDGARALVDAIDGGMARSHDRRLGADRHRRAVALQIAVERQHVVRDLGGLGHELVAHDQAIQLLERVRHLRAARVVEHRVALDDDRGGNLAGLDGVEGGHAARCGEARRAARRLAGDGGKLLDAGRRKRVVGDVGRAAANPAALAVEVAQQRVDQVRHAARVEAVLVARAERAGPRHVDEARRGVLPQLGRDGRDLAIGDAGLLAGPGQIVGAHLLGEFLKARGVRGQERLVVVAVAHQLGGDADQKRELRAGDDRHPLVHDAAEGAHARIDEHDLRVGVVALGGELGHLGRARAVVGGLVQHQGVFRILDVGRGIGAGDALDGGRDVGVMHRGVVVVMGAAQALHEPLGERRAVAARLQDGGLAAGGRKRRANLGEGVVPGDLLELRPVLLQRLGQTVLGVRHGNQALAAAAQTAAGAGMPRLARDAPYLAVAHPGHHAALVAAAVAQGVHLLGLGGFGRLGERLIPGAEARVAGAPGKGCRPRRAGDEAAPGNSLL